MKKSCLILSLISILFGTTLSSAYSSYSYSSSYDTFPTFALVIILIYITFFVVWFLVARWVYKDAQKRGLESPMLWGVLAFFGGIIGVIIYVVMRNNLKPTSKAPRRFCPSCGRNIPFDANICPYCGKKFESCI